MKYLPIGDPHAKKDNLDESKRLLDWIRPIAIANNLRPIFLGDLFNDFGVVRTEVLEFWHNEFENNWASLDPIVLVGNHDEDTQGDTNALSVFSNRADIISKKPVRFERDKKCAYLGFIRDNAQFITEVNWIAANWPEVKYVFCHAEFDGALFETGFPSPHGIKLDELPKHITFISGHIHKRCQFANVIYVGTPRWLTKADANATKAICIFDSDTGTFEWIETPESVAKPFRSFEITPETDLSKIKELKLDERSYVEVTGPQDFIKAVLKKLPDDAKVRSIPDKEIVRTVKESDGLAVAFNRFFELYVQEHGLTADVAQDVRQQLMKSIGHVLC